MEALKTRRRSVGDVPRQQRTGELFGTKRSGKDRVFTEDPESPDVTSSDASISSKDATARHRIPEDCVEPVPEADRKEDELPFRFTHLEAIPHSPVAVFINPKSGGNRGLKLQRVCQNVLNSAQIVDLLAEHGPTKTLKLFSTLPQFRVLVCGGDGTVAWVLQELDKLGLLNRVEVATIPLGTGNDLSRVLGWGPGYDGVNIGKFLHMMDNSQSIMFDRWDVEMTMRNGETKHFVMNNYFSIGMSAAVALKFDQGRRENPGLHKSRVFNKAMYAIDGLVDSFLHSCKHLHEKLHIECDGETVTVPDIEDIIVLNIPSFAGGTDLWGATESKKDPKLTTHAAMSDGRLEMVAVKSSLHMGTIKVGLAAPIRLKQVRVISITVKSKGDLPFQLDGEPQRLDFVKVLIKHRNCSHMLFTTDKDKEVLRRSKSIWDLAAVNENPIGLIPPSSAAVSLPSQLSSASLNSGVSRSSSERAYKKRVDEQDDVVKNSLAVFPPVGLAADEEIHANPLFGAPVETDALKSYKRRTGAS